MKFKFELLKKYAERLLNGYQSEKDPAIIKLKKIKDAIERDNWVAAENFINAIDLRTTMENRKLWFKDIRALKGLYEAYEGAKDLINKKQKLNAINLVSRIIAAFGKAENEINALQRQKAPGN
jgi:hypothetical protein